MSDEREKLLARITAGLRQAVLPAASPAHPESFPKYSFGTDTPVDKLIEDFTRELRALSGHVYRAETPAEAISIFLGIARNAGARHVLAWSEICRELPELESALPEAGLQVVEGWLPADRAERQARLAELDGVTVGLTGAQGGLTDTGSLALISGPGRGRLVSLLPPVHVALLPAGRLYPSLPAFLAAQPNAAAEGSNLVLITGPSRTADIEMTLSIGVHGPKEIHVIITP